MICLSPLPSVVQGPCVADVVPLVQDAHQGGGAHSFLACFLHHVGLKIDMHMQVCNYKSLKRKKKRQKGVHSTILIDIRHEGNNISNAGTGPWVMKGAEAL